MTFIHKSLKSTLRNAAAEEESTPKLKKNIHLHSETHLLFRV
jgi:hypothetical protein